MEFLQRNKRYHLEALVAVVLAVRMGMVWCVGGIGRCCNLGKMRQLNGAFSVAARGPTAREN